MEDRFNSTGGAVFPRLLLIYKNAKWINYDRIRERRSNGRCSIVRDFKFHFAAALIF